MRVELHPEAREELRSAALWYEEKRAGLGNDFVAEVASSFERLAASPSRYPIWLGHPRAPIEIRRARVNRFPYVVAFEVRPNDVLILAVAHMRRKPLYWLARST